MKNNLIFLFSIICLSSVNVLSMPVDTTVLKYYPLHTGDRWTWQIEANVYPGPGYKTMRVGNTQVYSGKFYFNCYIDFYYTYMNQHNSYIYFLRMDSVTGNLFRYYTDQYECLVDSLASGFGDSSRADCSTVINDHCDTISIWMFGMYIQTKRFGSGSFEAGVYRNYAVNFGEVYDYTYALNSYSATTLKGCYINGILTGDTSFPLALNQISTEVPNEFSLSQNYPNPFNPRTLIKFDIPPSKRDRGMNIVRLIIYDALGKEVASLVNEQLQPGTYEADWDGTNYPSGVYYYQLSVGNEQLATKKMVLMK